MISGRVLLKSPGGIKFTTKRSIVVKETCDQHKHHEHRKHHGHHGHSRTTSYMCIAETTFISPVPVTVILDTIIIIISPIVTEPIIIISPAEPTTSPQQKILQQKFSISNTSE